MPPSPAESRTAANTATPAAIEAMASGVRTRPTYSPTMIGTNRLTDSRV